MSAVATREVADRFYELADGVSGLTFRNMFGWRCAFFDGNMQGGYLNEQVMLRLSEVDRAEFLNLPDAQLFNPKGDRPMREYVSVPAEVVHSQDFTRWFEKSLRYAASLPPKAKRARAETRTARG